MTVFEVEIVLALPDRQSLKTVSATDGDTVIMLLAKSGLRDEYPDYDFDSAILGIWGREVDTDTLVKSGDRIEFYRPLQLNPRDARRQLAEVGRTMGGADANQRSGDKS